MRDKTSTVHFIGGISYRLSRLMPRFYKSNLLEFFLPALTLLVFVVTYARSFPIWETWYFVPVWKDYNQNGPWISDLFINHWYHISALPNFVNLMIDRLADYDQRVDIFISILTAIVALFLLLRYYVPREAALSRIFLGCTFLSLRATEIWLDGWNTAMTISLLLSIAAGACVLATRSWRGLFACGLLTFLGLNSGGYCVAALPAVLLTLMALAWQAKRAISWYDIAQILVWLCWMAFLFGYWHAMTHNRDGGVTAIVNKVIEPGFTALFFQIQALMLGKSWMGIAVLTGTLLLLLANIAKSGWRSLALLPALPGAVYMIAYSAVLCVLIETGRTSSGMTPLHLRYIPFLCILPVALLVLTENLSKVRTGEITANGLLGARNSAWCCAINLAIFLFVISAIWNDLDYYLHQSLPYQPQLAALDRAWRQSPWSLTPGMFLYRAATLATMRELRIGPFGRIAPAAPHLAREKEKQTADIHFGVDNATRNPDGNWVVLGWAFDTRRGLLMSDVYGQLGSCYETALRGLPRPDVSAFFKTSHATNSGWMLTFPAKCATSPHPAIKVYFAEKNGLWNSGEKQP
jgi:hypothetical protein